MSDAAQLETKYYLRTAAAAADISVPLLNKWLLNDIIRMRPGQGDIASTGTGNPRGFSLRRIYQIALTAEMTRRGLSASEAAEIALDFTDLGQLEGPGGGRSPGQLFTRGFTIFLITGEREDRKATLLRVSAKESAAGLLLAKSGAHASVILVNVNALVNRVHKNLGLEPIMTDW